MEELLKKLKRLDKLNKECQDYINKHEDELLDKLYNQYDFEVILKPQFMLTSGSVHVFVPLKEGTIVLYLDAKSDKFEQLF